MQNEHDMEAFISAVAGVGSFEYGQFLSYAEKKALENYREWYRMSQLIRRHESDYKKYYKAYKLAGGRPITEIEGLQSAVVVKEPEPVRVEAAPLPQPKAVKVVEGGKSDPARGKQRRLGVSLEGYAEFCKIVHNVFGEWPSDTTCALYYGCDRALPKRWRVKAVAQNLLPDVGYIRNNYGFLDKVIDKLGPFKMGAAEQG